MTEPVLLLAALGEAFGEVNDVYPSTEAVWRVLAATALGAVIGFEREVDDQPAGLRTHLTVALGAAVFGVISTLGFSEFVTDQRDVNVQFDVTRVASQVVVGIGFLGAGIIFRAGSRIRNLTTAASLWVTAAIGLAAGVGDIGIAIIAAAVLLFALLLLLRIPRDLIRNRLTRSTAHVSIRVAATGSPDAVLEALRSLDHVRVSTVAWGKHEGDTVLDLTMEAAPTFQPEQRLAPIVARDDVVSLNSDSFLDSQVREET
ncbi:MgtC/SapB family protein [Acidimicrobiia bacterium EGI L10123]|uniref:MgtC/SapB family protein n=1 Tax=Salinilacustrithrix flava TaxID=2957203 RepID=UPI003D7C1B57|nr:MgtC/SapB family protein [Acidimicrobiia bacterium EGI L10123]